MEKLKIFDKSDKRMREEEKKMREMNEMFEAAALSENYPGPLKRTLMQGVNDVTRQFVGEDEARAMRHARKYGNIKRSRNKK